MNRNPMKISAVLEVISPIQNKTLARRLEKAKAARIDNALGKSVVCVEGSLWVTQTGDPADYVLEAGQSLDIGRNGPVVVSALASSSFVLA